MSRIQYRDLEVVETLEMQQLAAIYGAGFFGNIFNLVKGILNLNPINKNFQIGGVNVGVQANGQGVGVQGNYGGFNFGFGYNW